MFKFIAQLSQEDSKAESRYSGFNAFESSCES
jgi:hypothetical protein